MADATITADILNPNPGPALSATSNMPVLDEAPADATTPPPAPDAPEVETPPAESEDGETGETNAEGEEGAAEQHAAVPDAKKVPGVGRRLGELTRKAEVAEAAKTEAIARAEAAERSLQEALARIPKPEDAPPPPPEPRPLRETFDTPEDFETALVEWSAKRALEAERAERAQHDRSEKDAADRAAIERHTQDNFSTVQAAHTERVATFAEAHPDYEAVTTSDDVPISAVMAMAILESDDGPAAAYHLGQNPEVAKRIAAMVLPGQFFPEGHPFAGYPVPNAQRQLLEMGKLFASVTEPAPTPPKPATPPPPAPITPLRRGSNAAVARTLDDIGRDTSPGSMDEYARNRMPQLQAERRPGAKTH